MTRGSSAPSLGDRARGDLWETVLRWRHADYRLVVGFAVAAGVVLARVGAAFIDVEHLETYLTMERSSRFGGQASFQTPNCRMVPGLLLGNDRNGYSLALTLVESVEAFFLPALLSCAIAIVFGTLLGALTGYFRGGRLDGIVRLGLTVVASFPRLILVIVAVGFFVATLHDPGRAVGLRLTLMGTILGIAYVPVLAAAIDQRVGAFQREQFVEAARAHGLSDARILGYHILWANCRPLLARHFFYLFGYFILVETGLSYLGPEYGVPGSIPSWGNLLAGCAKGDLLAPAVLAPAAAIVVSILGLTFLGDGIGEQFERGHA